MPKVSVIIPTCNRPHLIGRAIQTVLDQTFQDFEIIVVDDGFEKVAEVAVRAFNDPRIRYIRNEKNLGGGGTRNRGIQEAMAELVAFLDDDDEWHPSKLQQQVGAFENLGMDVSVVFTGVRAVADDGQLLYERLPRESGQYRPLKETLSKCFIWTSALMARKSYLKEVQGFDAGLRKNQEWDLQIRLLQTPSDFFAIHDPLTTIHISNKEKQMGGVGNLENRIHGYEFFLKKHRTLYRGYPKAYANRLFHVSTLYRDWNKHWSATAYRFRSWRLDPFNVTYALHALVSLSGEFVYTKLRRQ